ncbi:chromosome segregation protein SMC [Carnimonas nigrificans]|uniref:chromosome segregation protein SMC n=1 Tax=Carnimonas nigrificans TaxID=64323 RepID=UPI000470A497|nr:chromosome segregation protein SMC [Carnimonas nigrificans]
MRLKSIKLVGFKSFVDAVTVPFESNMTAIVGPNGCGKSNVIDAVRWVMGESSAKMLRGESMADVIFNGSTGRKPVGQASIELTFDNDPEEPSRKLGGAYAQYAEISVKRLVTRDGQSLYFFNGEKCRRRDISDLFLGTGLGPRSYAIIGQGMISRLVEARPEELRATLEEAAGISKYKERRRETENRMRRTEENLERLNDLREELDKQLERLKRQADAAKRYQGLKEQEHRLKGELALMRTRALRDRQQQAEAQVRDIEIERERNVYGVREAERLLEQARLDHDQLAVELDSKQTRFSETSAAIARIEQWIDNAQARHRQIATDLDGVDREVQELATLEEQDQGRLTELEQRLEEIGPEREQAEQQLELLQARLEEVEAGQTSSQAAWDDAVAQDNARAREVERLQGDVRSLERELESISTELARRQAQRSELPELAGLEEQRETYAEQLAELEETLAALDEQRELLNAERDEVEEALQHYSAEREQRVERQHQLRGEHASLSALIDAALAHQDDSFSAYLTAQGLGDSPQLAERLRVSKEWESAASWVLSPWLDARVVATPVTTIEPPATGELGVIDEGEYPASENTLAGKIEGAGALGPWLDTIHVAASPLKAGEQLTDLPAGHSVITADGLWLGHGWRRQLGSAAREDGVIGQRQRRDDVELELAALDEQLGELDVAIAQQRDQLKNGDARLTELANQQRQQGSERERIALAQANIASRLEHLGGRAAELEEELAVLRERQEERALVLEEQREAVEQAQQALLESGERREQLEQARRSGGEALTSARVAVAPAREQVSQLALEYQRLNTEREGMLRSRGRGDGQRERLHMRREALLEERENLSEPLEEQRAELDELLAQRSSEEEALGKVREQSRDIGERMRDYELRRQGHESDLEKLRERLEEMRMQVQELVLKATSQDEYLAELGHDSDQLSENLPHDATESSWQASLEETAERIKCLGAINLAAIEEYEQQSERRNYLEAQHDELQEALETLTRAIRKIDQETRTRFKETFEQVNAGLGDLFPRVFGGGSAWLTLTGDDLLETGVAIMARPPGKKNSTIHLLSGGEKTMTALSLVFAIFQLNPAPFCMLDEVDAPLDDANVGRYARLVKDMSANVQFIYITHNKIAMEAADRLMGVTMQEPGVSRLVSVDVEAAAALADA